jgi:hypothetical protein
MDTQVDRRIEALEQRRDIQELLYGQIRITMVSQCPKQVRILVVMDNHFIAVSHLIRHHTRHIRKVVMHSLDLTNSRGLIINIRLNTNQL